MQGNLQEADKIKGESPNLVDGLWCKEIYEEQTILRGYVKEDVLNLMRFEKTLQIW